MCRAWTHALQQIEQSQTKAMVYYKDDPKTLNVGDLVRVHTPVIKTGVAAKFHKPWSGPFRVLRVQNSNVLVQLIGSRKSPHYIHYDRCKLVRVSEMPTLEAPEIPEKRSKNTPTTHPW